MIYHVLISFPIIFRGQSIPHNHKLSTVIFQKRHSKLAAFIPAAVMSHTGQSDVQLYLTKFRLLLEAEQDFTRPHIYPLGSAHPKTANTLLIKTNELISQSLLEAYASCSVFFMPELEP